METIIYIGKVSLYWVLLYACYWLMLRKHTFFQGNRTYLITSLLAALFLPQIIYPESAPELPVMYQVSAETFTVSAAKTETTGWTWTHALAGVYALGLLIALSHLIREIARLIRYLRSGEVIELEDCTIVLIDSNQVGSFSFLKWIVINRSDYEHHFDAILRHEMVHTQQRHSLDILLVEVLRAIFWFNPVLLLYKRSLQEIHEYLADAQAPNREHYARFLVAYALNAPVASLTNHFFKPSQIKNRIQMIYKNRTSKWMLGTYVVAATLIGTSALFVAGCENQVSKENGSEKSEAPSTGGGPVFTIVEQQPEYPGGNEAMYHFLARNIKYPSSASRADVSGKVFVNFVVTTDGDIQDVKVLKGIGFGCDEEAVRVISDFPKWTPGRQNGKAVNVKYTVPIMFQLAEEGEDTTVKDPKETTVVGYKKIAKPVSEKVRKDTPIPGETFQAQPLHDADQNLATKITIRKSSGPFTASNQPLYVLNGEIVEDPLLIKTMDPNIISSMNVLKGESATKIYGERGANGVISILTKNNK
ncbi:hypothetical protein GCM10010967_52890 [Dyadobacter beijingensis]|uniref:TonB C-terminal domain-containing protein n=1 Tax=Dyadobacter beijingensis TaxID=365489 RepID=A0ABQ2IGG8_9BACT|nr:M56 family metallopeptidase [Dyadobacter beijingensis]GGN10447.1 hypothetical protein GCM10010967_52890 [Dyadobacter beijingensis]